MKNIYGLYRHFYTERGNRYPPSFYLGKQFQDLAMAWFISLDDNSILENNYTKEVSPWIKSMRRFIKCSYNQTKLSDIEFKSIVDNVSSMNDIVLFDTVELARQWVRDNTDLVETSTPWKFITVPKTEASEEMEATEEQYLIIN